MKGKKGTIIVRPILTRYKTKDERKKGLAKGQKSVEEINSMTTNELAAYWKQLRRRVQSRVNYMKKQGITHSPALKSLIENNFYANQSPSNNRNELLKDVAYFDKFLYEFKTSRKRGFEKYVSQSIYNLTGLEVMLTYDEATLFYELIDKIRELRPDLAKGTDRYRYRVIFNRVLSMVVRGYSGDDILKTLQDEYDTLLQELEKKQAKEKEEREKQIDYLFEIDTSKSHADMERFGVNKVEKLYDYTDVERFWKSRGY